MKLRVGIVGLGPRWELWYAPALKSLSERFEVRCVCDAVAHRAATVAAQCKAQFTRSFRDLVQRADVDAILVFSAELFATLPVAAACDAGKAVFCAVRLANSEPDARRMHELVRKSGIAFMAGLTSRHAPALARLKELIAKRLGPIRHVFVEQRGPSPALLHRDAMTAPDDWLELIDVCRFIISSEPDSVLCYGHDMPAADASGQSTNNGSGLSTRDSAWMQLRFAHMQNTNPVSAQIRRVLLFAAKDRDARVFRAPADLHVVCERGMAFVDLPSRVTWFDEAGQHTESVEPERPVQQQLLLSFHHAVTSLILKMSSLDDAYRAVAIAAEADQSARHGCRRPITYHR